MVEDVERQVVAERLHQNVASSDVALAPYVELSAGLRGLNLVALNEGEDARILEVHKDVELPLLKDVVPPVEDRDLEGGRGRGGGTVGRFVAGRHRELLFRVDSGGDLGSSAEASGAGDADGGSGNGANGSSLGVVDEISCRESSESDDAMDGLITCRTRQEAGPPQSQDYSVND